MRVAHSLEPFEKLRSVGWSHPAQPEVVARSAFLGLVAERGKLLLAADREVLGLSMLAEHPLPWWITIVVLVREIGVTLLRFFVIRHGVMPASRGGKLKTLVQAIAIGLLVLPLGGWLHDAAMVVMYVAVVVTVVTGVDYVQRALRLRRTSERAAMKRARRVQP